MVVQLVVVELVTQWHWGFLGVTSSVWIFGQFVMMEMELDVGCDGRGQCGARCASGVVALELRVIELQWRRWFGRCHSSDTRPEVATRLCDAVGLMEPKQSCWYIQLWEVAVGSNCAALVAGDC